MRTRWILSCLPVALAALLVSPAAAQSVNIDLGPSGGSPPPEGYRGAGLPGHWHRFEATTWGQFHNLNDLDGNPIATRVRQIGGTEIVSAAFGAGDPQGGDAVLLRDALVTHAIENCLFFDNLQNGRYEVLSYAWMPTVQSTLNHVWIDDHPDEPMIGGDWPGKLKQGVVYARHEFDVTVGILNMHSGIPSGDPAEPGAALGGIQLRRMVEEPPLFVDRAQAVWLPSLNATSYDVARGDLATLRSSGGDFTLAVEPCLANDTSSTAVGNGADPAPGDGHWFLVRGVDTGLGSTWNAPGSSQVGDRDGELAASCN